VTGGDVTGANGEFLDIGETDNGSIILGGAGQTNNEALEFDFETTANEVGISSSTGVTRVNFGSLDITVNSCTGCGGGGGDAGYGVEAVTVHTTNGTFVKAAYVNNVYVEVWGGGAGALPGTANVSAGGGGAGGYSAGITTVAANVSVVVGTGGGNNANGTVSQFPGGVTLQGSGGVRPTTTTGGAGGAATNGTINIPGQAGSNGASIDGHKGGWGGDAPFGGGGGAGGGGGNLAGNVQAATNGANGAIPGGGGGGGGENNGVAGNGADGLVIVWALSGTNGSDLAELYETKPDVEAGDVVSISQDSIEYDAEWGLQKMSVLEKATPGSRVVGVVSISPSVTMGRTIKDSPNALNPQPIALAGRTPVKVSEENGPIKAGDLLGPSSVPGVASKNEKAGFIIGAALEDYVPPEDGSQGKVMIFVHTEYSSGARTNVLLERAGLNPEEIPEGTDVSRIMLAQLLTEKREMTKETPLSEIFTDRVVAGLEIIAPRVLTDTLVVDSVEPVEQNLHLKVVEGGKLVLSRLARDDLSTTFSTGPPGTTILSVDDLGNAIFAGSLTVAGVEIGTPEKPGGITFYDTATGDPYCSRVTNGQFVTTAGKCANNTIVLPEALASPASPAPTTSTTDPPLADSGGSSSGSTETAPTTDTTAPSEPAPADSGGTTETAPTTDTTAPAEDTTTTEPPPSDTASEPAPSDTTVTSEPASSETASSEPAPSEPAPAPPSEPAPAPAPEAPPPPPAESPPSE
jgi:hypothetical protein